MISNKTTRRWAGIVFCLGLLVGMGSLCFAADPPTTKPVDFYGRVVGPNDKPVAGAHATLMQYQQAAQSYVPVASTTSDADGRFQFTGADPQYGGITIVQAQ